MATARHPTTEPDGEADGDETDRLRHDGDHPTLGVAHVTVVPTNYDDT